jgi:hypothetical protein
MENSIVHRDSRSRESVRYTPTGRALWSTNAVATLRAMLESCFQSFLTKSNVGRSPWTAVDALVGLRLTGLARPDLGVRRGRGRPPHIHRYKNFRNRTLGFSSDRLMRVALPFFALAIALNADSIGVAADGTCGAGSCPAVALPFNSSATLPVDFFVTLANGDTYLIDGSFSSSNGTNGGTFTASHLFQITYEGNATGGVSAADTVTVDAFFSFEASVSTTTAERDVIGAFSPTIAASSSASSCLNVVLGCAGPFDAPGSFDQSTSAFTLVSSGGAFEWDPSYTNNFGAGSAVGSYIVWGQTTALPPPSVPEPASLWLLVLGLSGIFVGRVTLGRTGARKAPGA